MQLLQALWQKYFENCMEIVNKSIPHLEYKFSQIYRRDQVDLNCSRHFSIFNKFNVIPDYCFSCYKIQIETQNVLDLIKLYLVFDNLELNFHKNPYKMNASLVTYFF